MERFDFSGWATKANLKCSDGRIITPEAFKHQDGATVPMVWNHQHTSPDNVLGQALLEHRDEGTYAYCTFNDSESGKTAKLLVEHGDVNALSIAARQLKQQGPYVQHGAIFEVSLVLAGANPGAFIESVMKHGEECEDEAVIYTGENISLYHADEKKEEEEKKDDESEKKDKTIGDVFDSMNDEQKMAAYAVIAQALKHNDEGDDDDSDDDEVEHSDSDDETIEHSEGGDETMKKNVFDTDVQHETTVLTHADQESIISMAKQNNVGSLQTALGMFAEKNQLQHGIDEIETLFPEYKDLHTGAPETIKRDLVWVAHVMKGTHKAPFSRIRTRLADARGEDLRAYGYKQKGMEKKVPGNIKLMKRTTDPQTVYRKDAMHRDDIIDITDFDVVAYQWGIMRENLEEEIARAILIGDGRDDGDEMKISEEHIRPIWKDDELYCIHADIDIEAMRKELQGTDTGLYFGDNFVRAEAMVQTALYAREKYRGSGSLEYYCTPHELNVMLLSRDRNGHRMYSSKADLAAALNVTAIHTVEQFEGLVRTDADGKKHKLLGLFVNLSDYQVGCTKGGEITKFSQFDIDFNQYKYLIETRISGALIRPWSAIAIEELVEG